MGRHAAAMVPRGQGSIINIASMYGVVASYPSAYEGLAANSPPNYHGLKGGLVHLTRHLAAYWAEHDIRVNAISPGFFPDRASADGPGCHWDSSAAGSVPHRAGMGPGSRCRRRG